MSKIIVTPPQIDTDLFRPRPKYENLIVSVGRLSPEKNHAPLILAVAEIPWARLMIISDGPLAAQLIRLAVAVEPRVVLTGSLPNAEVAKVLGQATYFVLPSLYDQSPKVVWEAMASSCACIVSAQVGIVEDGVTGYLCEPSVCGISTAIERARKDEKRQRVVKAARRWVEGHPSTSGSLIVESGCPAASGA